MMISSVEGRKRPQDMRGRKPRKPGVSAVVAHSLTPTRGPPSFANTDSLPYLLVDTGLLSELRFHPSVSRICINVVERRNIRNLYRIVNNIYAFAGQ
jgi:hypothetical protein